MKRLTAWLKPENNFLYAVLGFSLLLRLAYVLKTGPGGLSPDAHDWLETAWRVASGRGFGNSWRPPGFVFFLTAVFKVFGKSAMAAKLIQALLGTATVALTYGTARRLFTRGTARVAAVLLSFYPYLVAYTADLLSETFLTFILACAVYYVTRVGAEPRWKNIVPAGILIGLAGLTKSVVLPFFVFACAWLWWRSRSFKAGFMVGVFTILTILPWSFRNYFHYDSSYVMPVSSPWFSLYGSSCDEAFWNENRGELDSPQTFANNSPAIPKDWGYLSSLSMPERDKICKEKAVGWIRANPDKFLALIRLRLSHFWRLYPMMAYKWQKYAAMATSGLYIPLALAGLLLSLQAFGGAALLAGLFFFYTLVHIFFVVTLRYRVPIDPYVIILAAYALERGYLWFKTWQTK